MHSVVSSGFWDIPYHALAEGEGTDTNIGYGSGKYAAYFV